MILVLLIVVPCAIVGIGVVTLFDRTGVFSGLDGGREAARRPSSGLANGIPRTAMIGVLVMMGAWVLAWIVLLIVGLGIMSG